MCVCMCLCRCVFSKRDGKIFIMLTNFWLPIDDKITVIYFVTTYFSNILPTIRMLIE